MIQIFIPVGISGAGKSTFISHNKSKGDIVLSPDDIRRSLSDVSDQSQNDKVFSIFYDLFEKSLIDGNRIWLDQMNISKTSLENILSRIEGMNNIKVDFILFSDSEKPYVCLERVFKDISSGVDRSNTVIDGLHEKMSERYLKIVPEIQNLCKSFPDRYSVHMNAS